MMLRSLVDELVRRRLWPIPLVAVLVAVVAVVAFMKSAPADAPAATEAPPAAAPGKLPKTAAKLVEASDKAVIGRRRRAHKRANPFVAPASVVKAAAAAEAKKTASANGKSAATTASATHSSATSTSSKTKIPVIILTPKPSTSTSTSKSTITTAHAAANRTVTYVDVRFAKRMGSMTRFRIPRLQTLRAGGEVAAMFVKYSPARHKAVFAIAPSTQVGGDGKCRKVAGVCRYVDLAAGKYARLTLRASDGSVISRRLDVVRIRTMPYAGNETASARSTPLAAATCLLKTLLKLPATLPSIPADACE